ncbi:MAG: tetratricopeptide repeat protein [Kovacikia sp.]
MFRNIFLILLLWVVTAPALSASELSPENPQEEIFIDGVPAGVRSQAIAANNQGVEFLAQKQYDSAIASFRQALSIDATYARARHNLSIAYYRQGLSLWPDQKQEAQNSFRKALEVDSSNPQIQRAKQYVR